MSATTQRTRRTCKHARVHHEHGTAGAYLRDSCRCQPCTDAMMRERKQYEVARLRDRHNALVDPAPACAHIAALCARYGVAPEAVTRAAGLNAAHGRRMLGGMIGKITRQVERAILRVRFEDLDRQVYMSARGARRRLQALALLGYTCTQVADVAPVSMGTLLRVQSGMNGTVRIEAHEAVAAFFEAHWDCPRTAADLTEHRVILRTVRKARALGWAPAAAWDDIDMDARPRGIVRAAA